MSHPPFEAPQIAELQELIPAYEILDFIAKGGMGAVYRARQRFLDREVAIKILPREFGEDAEFRRSFETEAKAMARLNHPNLISVYDFGDVRGMPYIVMEYINGKSLFHSAWKTVVEPTQAVQIVKGICAGLAHAHANGVIHRDIKPANILLTPNAEPKIGDFGLALAGGQNDPGLVMGTPGYAAPARYDNLGDGDDGIQIHGDVAITMGNVWVTDKDGNETMVDKTFVFKKGEDGKLKLIVHKSALPFAPAK